ncbi:MAG TPA: sigma-54 dependent transcriptional regulator [Acetobacteraceae bacterium]|nr:sigma-54 dependent transcriptional regulator [Acetobacteraceae bacterium]
MVRVTLADVTRLPMERLAQLLMEWAAEDQTLLARLHAKLSGADGAPVSPAAAAQPEPATPTAPKSEPPKSEPPKSDIVGESAAMQSVSEMLQRYAQTDEPVLITGESGTGKEMVARAIHENSRRHTGPFVAVNCAAIPSGLVASELFGYEKGAFTGAAARTKGQVEHAHGGTLFLDEIGDMPVDLQGHLLRFLQEGQIVRVGGRETINVDVRVVSATNVRLHQAMGDGRFREDLYYRLNVLTLRLPPLRERPEDVELLARHFLRQAAAHFGREVVDFAPDAMEILRQYHWPGNVRELMSTIRRTVVIGNSSLVTAADLVGLSADRPEYPVPTHSTGSMGMPPSRPARPRPGSEAERSLLLGALANTEENITLTAQELGVSRVTLYRMLNRHAIVLNRGMKAPPGA